MTLLGMVKFKSNSKRVFRCEKGHFSESISSFLIANNVLNCSIKKDQTLISVVGYSSRPSVNSPTTLKNDVRVKLSSHKSIKSHFSAKFHLIENFLKLFLRVTHMMEHIEEELTYHLWRCEILFAVKSRVELLTESGKGVSVKNPPAHP